MTTKDFPETHKQGLLSIENLEHIQAMNKMDCDVGVQIAYDGRIWLCVNDVAFIRFKPDRTKFTVVTKQ